MSYDPKPLVAAGVAFLDSYCESIPELEKWEYRVDLENLDMNYGWQCVLGQLFGHYDWVSHRPLSRRPIIELDEPTAISCGFRHNEDIPVSERVQYIALTDEWKRVITDRLVA
jgi:hypothetical protein